MAAPSHCTIPSTCSLQKNHKSRRGVLPLRDLCISCPFILYIPSDQRGGRYYKQHLYDHIAGHHLSIRPRRGVLPLRDLCISCPFILYIPSDQRGGRYYKQHLYDHIAGHHLSIRPALIFTDMVVKRRPRIFQYGNLQKAF